MHGGAYAHPLGRGHWWIVERLVRGTGVTVTVPLYRLAPEGDALQARALLGQVLDDLPPGADVTLAGDSAGAAVVLAHAQVLRDTGGRAVDRVVLLSPWLDITLRHPEVTGLEHEDVVLQAAPTGSRSPVGRRAPAR